MARDLILAAAAPRARGAVPAASGASGLRHAAADLVAADPARVAALLADLPAPELRALAWLWEVWAAPHQLAPDGDWRSWVVLGGRGAGKTRAGAEWVRSRVEGRSPLAPGACSRVALVAETLDEAREVMVLGESGLMACAPPDRRPRWQATRRLLEWPNGATAQIFSASSPEALRGPQFDAAWADELAKWRRGQAAWDQLQLGLRLGADPRCVVTTTPRDSALLRALLDAPGTVVTHAPTRANRAHLAPAFLAAVETAYAGTALGRQELEGLLVEAAEGALWTPELLDRTRADTLPPLDRVVVAVDPAVSMGRSADATGIVAVGAATRGAPRDWHAFVLEDATVQGASPETWARAAVRCARRHGASRVVAESNQGGAMVADMLRAVDPQLAVAPVHARHGKAARAEPVAALYEQNRVHHLRSAELGALEAQMTAMTVTGFRGRGSPDRLDALVWAVTEALIAPARGHLEPRIRAL
jgi:phage terminase large subunit-like protein